ncbi:hypothetical protein B0H10DRAFT_286838 [Mycena sp. CBHHK59/15]|nr:hypothetical protein B0H10DRAFT_286838 [Mycena sp. CBHHK59/15]
MLTQLLAVFSRDYHSQLENLVAYLKNPEQKGFRVLSHKTDMYSLMSDIEILETDLVVNQLLYMCKLIQLALNVDQLRIEAVANGAKRALGLPAIAARFNKYTTTFSNWHSWGSRLLHLCCAGTMYILPIIACLSLRVSFTTGHTDTTRNINSLADAFREVKDGKWRPLVKRFIVAIQYLRSMEIPVLDAYEFVRGADTFRFSEVEKADSVLETVQTNLFKLPSRAPEWTSSCLTGWTPSIRPNPVFPEVVAIQTTLKLDRTTTTPFDRADTVPWTENQRKLAEEAPVASSVEDFKLKLMELHVSGQTDPGRYIELDPDILGGKSLTIDDATGLRVVTLLTMPDDLIQRLKTSIENLDSILPGEYRWENSRRSGYSYLVLAYTWYYRMGEQGDGAPTDAHPNTVHKGVKVNFSQRVPYSTVETIQKTMEYEALVEVFSEVFEFQRINFERLNPEAYEQVRMFADVLPLNTASPSYPFSGFMFNLRVVTDAHKDPKDKTWCEIIFLNECQGGISVCMNLD